MAKASWCNVSPMSGKENGTLMISAAAHAGRDDRSTTVTATAKNGGNPSASLQVIQAGAGVQLTMDTTKPNLPGEGGSVTINGNSNSPTLKISVPLINFPGVTAAAKFNAPGVTDKVLAASETVTIPGDPGANGLYAFSIKLEIARNPLPTPLSPNVDVTDSTGKMVRCQFGWAAGASTIAFREDLISLENDGTAKRVDVTSNDEWAVS